MLNIEFWKDRLKDLHAESYFIAVVNGTPELCGNTECSKCDFSENGCCLKLYDWLCEEYKEPEIELDWDNDIDWTRVPVDTDVLVKSLKQEEIWHLRKFAVYVPRSNAPYRTFNLGEKQEISTSVIAWKHCKFANAEDIEKYRKRG